MKANELQTLFKEYIDKNEINKNSEFLKNKILILSSILLNERNFTLNEANQKALTNALLILKSILSENQSFLVDTLFELFSLLQKDSDFQFDILLQILDIAYNNIEIFKLKSNVICNYINRVIENHQSCDKEKSLLNVMNSYAKILDKVSEYSSLKNVNFKSHYVHRAICIYLNENITNSQSKELNKLQFYDNIELVTFIDLKSFRKTEFPEFKEEEEVRRLLWEENKTDFSLVNVNYFNRAYGNDFGILLNYSRAQSCY